MNLWRGYGCEPKKGEVGPLKALIHHLCAGDAVEIDFMTKRFAIKLQKLWLKIPTFQCVVTDAEGSGKSQLGKFIAGLHGVHGKMVTDAEVDSQFHDWCKDGLTFAVCEEVNLRDKKGCLFSLGFACRRTGTTASVTSSGILSIQCTRMSVAELGRMIEMGASDAALEALGAAMAEWEYGESG